MDFNRLAKGEEVAATEKARKEIPLFLCIEAKKFNLPMPEPSQTQKLRPFIRRRYVKIVWPRLDFFLLFATLRKILCGFFCYVIYKTEAEIALLSEGGKVIGGILETLAGLVRPGASTAHIDTTAERLILEAGGTPAFKGYRPRGLKTPFPATICASVNAEVVHGIPTKEKF